MPTEREAISKRAAWEERKRSMVGRLHDHSLHGRWSCTATVVTRPCGDFSVVIHEGKAYCYSCGEPAPEAARILGVKEDECAR